MERARVRTTPFHVATRPAGRARWRSLRQPADAALVAFAAAWDPASFQFVFNLGAWMALAGGLTTGTAGWVFDRLRQARRARHATLSQPTPARLPT